MNILVVEDERLSREDLVFTIKTWDHSFHVTEAQNGSEAIRVATTMQPDLIFLDIHLPDMTGLEVAEMLKQLAPQSYIVFVTAYDTHAVQAFKLRAFHYILKPFTDGDIWNVLALVSKLLVPTSPSFCHKLCIETEGKTVYVLPDEVCYISKVKDEKKITFHTTEGVFEVAGTLQEWRDRLKTYTFFRVHKSYMVNLHSIVSIEPYFHGTYHVYLKPPYTEAIPVSRNVVKELKERMGQIV